MVFRLMKRDMMGTNLYSAVLRIEHRMWSLSFVLF